MQDGAELSDVMQHSETECAVYCENIPSCWKEHVALCEVGQRCTTMHASCMNKHGPAFQLLATSPWQFWIDRAIIIKPLCAESCLPDVHSDIRK